MSSAFFLSFFYSFSCGAHSKNQSLSQKPQSTQRIWCAINDTFFSKEFLEDTSVAPWRFEEGFFCLSFSTPSFLRSAFSVFLGNTKPSARSKHLSSLFMCSPPASC
uniref:Putative secreted protein n=1 Tax=Rhipicephalus microplus TaxID=6941 RepID=A0A6M2DAV6_RHIMP